MRINVRAQNGSHDFDADRLNQSVDAAGVLYIHDVTDGDMTVLAVYAAGTWYSAVTESEPATITR